MKINNTGTSGINPYKHQQNKLDHISTSAKKMADKVEISSAAKEMQQGTQYDAARQEKVEELKLQVESGNYKMNSKEVARGIYQFYFNR